jgi:hypothetical protein
VPDQGPQFGVRTGYGLPLGAAADEPNGEMSQLFSGLLPIWIDLGYRFSPSVYAGMFFQYGVAFIAKDSAELSQGCSQSGVSCSGSNIRFGPNLHYHILPAADFDPWIGIGMGFEFANLFVSRAGNSAAVSFEGMEFLDFQLGGDFKVTPAFGLGPFVSVSLGQYSTGSATMSGTVRGSVSGEISNKALHEWLTFGLRGVYNL